MTPVTDMTLKLLIVDDESALRRLTARMLTNQNFQISECGTGSEGLKAVEEDSFDLILIDHSLPDMTGTDFVEQVRSSKPDQRVVYISGHPLETCLPLEDRNNPKTGFLQKPFTRDDLRQTVDEYCGSRV